MIKCRGPNCAEQHETHTNVVETLIDVEEVEAALLVVPAADEVAAALPLEEPAALEEAAGFEVVALAEDEPAELLGAADEEGGAEDVGTADDDDEVGTALEDDDIGAAEEEGDEVVGAAEEVPEEDMASDDEVEGLADELMAAIVCTRLKAGDHNTDGRGLEGRDIRWVNPKGDPSAGNEWRDGSQSAQHATRVLLPGMFKGYEGHFAMSNERVHDEGCNVDNDEWVGKFA